MLICSKKKKKKESMPFLDLVSLDFLFPFFAKEMRASWLQQPARPAVRHYGKAAPTCAPSRCVGLAVTVLGAGLGPVLGTNSRQGKGWMKSSAHIYCVWPPALLCGATALFLSFSTPFYSVKAYSKKMLLQGSPEGMLLPCHNSCLTVS